MQEEDGPRAFEYGVKIFAKGFIQQARQKFEWALRALSGLWASRHASAQAVTSKLQLRATSPMNTSSSAGENGFSAKNGS